LLSLNYDASSAQVVKLVDIPSSDGGAFKSMLVRVQSWAPLKSYLFVLAFLISTKLFESNYLKTLQGQATFFSFIS
jgi:hypothetical protein